MLVRLFRLTSIPREYHSNFLHLYLDIAWFGVLNGTTLSFLSVYATRLGATTFQIGLLGAVSAFVNLFLAIPAGHWLKNQHTGQAIFRTAVAYRIGFLPLIVLPWWLDAPEQVVAIILLTFLMAIPLTPLGLGFNALFAEAVPPEYRAQVAGMRNMMLAITFILTSLLSGYLLQTLPFPSGYQVVFALGAVGAAMSTLHLRFLRPLEAVQPPQGRAPSQPRPSSVWRLSSSLRADIWKTPFRRVLLALFALHFTQYLPIPIFTIYSVRILGLTDDNLGIGTALFYVSVLIGSTQIRKLVQRFGNQKLTGWSTAALALYPFFLALSRNAVHYYGVSLVGGLAFALLSGSYANYMLEHIPADDRPSHLAWYTVILNAAILLGSLLGPALANQIGLTSSLMLFSALRIAAAVFVLRRG